MEYKGRVKYCDFGIMSCPGDIASQAVAELWHDWG